MRSYSHHLPPVELWPTRLLTADIEYPNQMNLGTVFLDRHVERGAAARTAIHADDGRVTYRELQGFTNRIGHALRTLGIEPGDRVAMRFVNGPPFAATWLAVQKIGAIGVSTMPMLRARELAYIVNDSEAALVVCQHDLIDEVARARSSFDRPVPIVTWGRGASNDAGPSNALEDLITTASDELRPHQCPTTMWR
jgi:2-aminobenzoate-CoA ligase